MKHSRHHKFITIWFLIFSLLSFAVHAKSPTAGTLIKNQATASYKDAAGVEQFATSNVVETLIQQVGAMDLLQDQSRIGAVGNTVYFPHVLTNTGNGVDTYDLTVENESGDDYDLDGLVFYADANKDGVPDNTTPITSTGALSSEESFYFVVAGVVPAGATVGQQAELTVKGASTFVETPTDLVVEQTNTDTVKVSDQAIINVTKSMSANSGAAPSGPYTVTLKYSNAGLTDATAVTLKDVLPAGMSYNLSGDAARWSVTGDTVTLTDTDATDPQGTTSTVTYCAYSPGCETEVQAVISLVSPGETGELTFEVNIDSGLEASTLINIAEFSYHDGSAVVSTVNTNQVPFEVNESLGVVANGSDTEVTLDADNLGGTTDSFVVSSATRGASVPFDNYIRNMGNTDDVFEITVDDTGTFPAGTVFQLFQSDGFTPLMDTNSNGTPDTGVMAVGEAYKVVLKAVLPVNASGDNGGAGFEVTKTATSALDDTVFDSVTDRLLTISADSVDLTNNSAGAGADGAGIGPESSPVTTENIVPGGQAVFSLFVNNTSDAGNSYSLEYSKENFVSGSFYGSDASVSSGSTVSNLWSVVFHFDGGVGDCSTLGQQTLTTSYIAGGSSQQICAVVTAPDEVEATGEVLPVYFKAYSQLTGSNDIKQDAVKVVEQPALSIEPDQIGQVEPGATIVYAHQVTNNGNTQLECVNVTAADADPQSGWSSVVYLDVNGDGLLDAGDTPMESVSPLSEIAPRGHLSVIVKLFAAGDAALGLKNTHVLTVTGNQSDGDGDAATCTGAALTDTVSDVTTVSLSKVSIIKEQAMDEDCDGTEEGVFSANAFQVEPEACIIYRLTATNTGAAPVNKARIDDASPNYTSFFGTAVVSDGNISGGVAGSEGSITGGSVGGANIILQSGEALVLTFSVKLD